MRRKELHSNGLAAVSCGGSASCRQNVALNNGISETARPSRRGTARLFAGDVGQRSAFAAFILYSRPLWERNWQVADEGSRPASRGNCLCCSSLCGVVFPRAEHLSRLPVPHLCRWPRNNDPANRVNCAALRTDRVLFCRGLRRQH